MVEAVRHARSVQSEIRKLKTMDDDELFVYAKEIQAPFALVQKTKELGEMKFLFRLRVHACLGFCVAHPDSYILVTQDVCPLSTLLPEVSQHQQMRP